MGLERRLHQAEATIEAIASPTAPRVVKHQQGSSLTVDEWERGEWDRDEQRIFFVAGIGAVGPGCRIRIDGRVVTGAELLEGIE